VEDSREPDPAGSGSLGVGQLRGELGVGGRELTPRRRREPCQRPAPVLADPTEGPPVDPDWGEAELSPAERVYGWNALEVLAFRTGNPDNPVNAIPPRATAHLQLRFVVGCDPRTFVEHVEI